MSLTSDRVDSVEQALTFLVECTLATVEVMAITKSRKKGEYSRQIRIAQHGVDWMRRFGIPLDSIRTKDITGTVEEWAKKIEV